MLEALDTLTDKEKETLRLMVRGHDAKSAARELDLSVHTINERLRAARRKLEVTSSREAARVLFESEGDSYENLGGKLLGDDPKGGALHQPSPSKERHAGGPDFRPFGRTMIMISLIAMMLVAPQATTQTETRYKDERFSVSTLAKELPEMESRALEWLELVDEAPPSTSLEAAATRFRTYNDLEQWERILAETRAPLGEKRFRVMIDAGYVNAPPFDYRTARFRTTFASRIEMIEKVTLHRENGEWKVIGYDISQHY